jgi:hypothetical protein
MEMHIHTIANLPQLQDLKMTDQPGLPTNSGWINQFAIKWLGIYKESKSKRE